mmetsp:Transcript_4607/g.10912  ORF Transcript_4607/g.10912 Transcript_4607/m.10912 type:complete len:262 (+) Transcript_4607:927-1712(+)
MLRLNTLCFLCIHRCRNFHPLQLQRGRSGGSFDLFRALQGLACILNQFHWARLDLLTKVQQLTQVFLLRSQQVFESTSDTSHMLPFKNLKRLVVQNPSIASNEGDGGPTIRALHWSVSNSRIKKRLDGNVFSRFWRLFVCFIQFKVAVQSLEAIKVSTWQNNNWISINIMLGILLHHDHVHYCSLDIIAPAFHTVLFTRARFATNRRALVSTTKLLRTALVAWKPGARSTANKVASLTMFAFPNALFNTCSTGISAVLATF